MQQRRLHPRSGSESALIRLTLPTGRWNQLQQMAEEAGSSVGATVGRLVGAVLEDDEAAETEEQMHE